MWKECVQGRRHRGDCGGHGCPNFWPLFQNICDNLKPRHICTSEDLFHVNIVVVSAVLALDAILSDTKKGGVVFWTCFQMKTEGTVFWTQSKMQKVAVLVEMRSMTIGLHLHAQLTNSTSNTDLYAREHFQN